MTLIARLVMSNACNPLQRAHWERAIEAAAEKKKRDKKCALQ